MLVGELLLRGTGWMDRKEQVGTEAGFITKIESFLGARALSVKPVATEIFIQKMGTAGFGSSQHGCSH